MPIRDSTLTPSFGAGARPAESIPDELFPGQSRAAVRTVPDRHRPADHGRCRLPAISGALSTAGAVRVHTQGRQQILPVGEVQPEELFRLDQTTCLLDRVSPLGEVAGFRL